MNETVKASEIYEEIIAINGINEVDKDSYIRNLRNKMTFIIEHVALRSVSDFKKGNNIMIPVNDAPIVRNLIMASLDDEYSYIVDWFNNSLNLSDAQTCLCLFMSIREPIMRAEIMGETDDVTVDEWISAIRGLLNVDMAGNTIKMKNKLEDFRSRTLVMNNTVSMGDVIVGHEDGTRSYAMKGVHEHRRLSEELLRQIVENLYLQNDYFDALGQIIDYMIEDAENKAIPYIERYAEMKSLSDSETAKQMIKGATDSMASEYYPWFKKIAAFLHVHPEEAQRIEKLADTNDLEKFFR